MFVTLVYSIPDWLLCIIVIVLVSVLAMAGLWLVHRRVPTEARQPHNEIAGFLINAIGVIFAVILAFIAVAVWESAGKAQDIVAAEANEATDILRNGAVYPEPLARRVRAGLRQYLTVVVTEEWRLQQDGAMSPAAWRTTKSCTTTSWPSSRSRPATASCTRSCSSTWTTSSTPAGRGST